MTLTTIEDRVHAGAALLDEKVPDWRERVDVDTLNISSHEHCVLGQLGGTYIGGVFALFGTEVDFEIPRSYGFNCSGTGSVADQLDEYRDLNHEWKKELQAA